MATNSSIGVMKSVGRGGVNERVDVGAVQQRLNALMGPSRQRLKHDGKVGSKTIGAIIDFQKSVVGLRRPDGRVDPAGKTVRAMNDPNAASAWRRMCVPPEADPSRVARESGGGEQGRTRAERLLAEAADAEGEFDAFNEFRRELIDKAVPEMKKFLGSLGRSEDARKVIAAWVQLRKWGFSTREAATVMRQVSGLKGYAPAVNAFGEIGKATGALGRFISTVGAKAGAVGHVVTLVEVADKFEQGDYLYGASELYKHFMGEAIPWAGMVEGLQSLVEAVAPKSAKNARIFRIIRACDPIGLGASAVDSMTTLVLSTIYLIDTGRMDMARLSRLVDRMKQGPTRLFAEMGEDLGDSVYEMSRWRRDDWTYAINHLDDWVMSWF